MDQKVSGASCGAPMRAYLHDVSVIICPDADLFCDCHIRTILGEIGAGRSTLMKVLSSVYRHGRYRGDWRDSSSVTTIWDEVKQARNWNEDVTPPLGRALAASGGRAVLGSNLAPNGPVAKPFAASLHVMQQRSHVVVFKDTDDYKVRANDDALDIHQTCVMGCINCGPKGYPGMSEVGTMGLPPQVQKKRMIDAASPEKKDDRYGADFCCPHTRPRLW